VQVYYVAIYKAHLVGVRTLTQQSPWQICSGCPPRWICCRSYTSGVFKSCLVLPETWRRDHLWNHWQMKKAGCWCKDLEVPCIYTPCMGKPS